MSLRIVLAQRHLLLLQGLQELLKRYPDLEVVAAVQDGGAALRAVEATLPDLVVLDCALPDLSGVEATRMIKQSLPGVKVVCLSLHANERYARAMLEAGVEGYVTWSGGIDELRLAIDSACAGQLHLSPKIARDLVGVLMSGRGHSAIAPRALTAQERRVLQLIAEGHSTKEIAAKLGVSVKTVGSHRERTMHKLGIHSIAGLTKYAIGQGLTTQDLTIRSE